MAGDPKFGEVKGRVSNDNIKSAGAKIFRVLNPDGPKQAPQVQKLFGKKYTPNAAKEVGHATVTTEDIKNYGARLKPATNRRMVTLTPERSASGYIPSFAVSPLDAAVNREVAAGAPLSQIRVNQSGKLRNAANPQGLAVTNMRDEPTGAIPNYAAGDVKLDMSQGVKMLDKETKKTTAGLKGLGGRDQEGKKGSKRSFGGNICGTSWVKFLRRGYV